MWTRAENISNPDLHLPICTNQNSGLARASIFPLFKRGGGGLIQMEAE